MTSNWIGILLSRTNISPFFLGSKHSPYLMANVSLSLTAACIVNYFIRSWYTTEYNKVIYFKLGSLCLAKKVKARVCFMYRWRQLSPYFHGLLRVTHSPPCTFQKFDFIHVTFCYIISVCWGKKLTFVFIFS